MKILELVGDLSYEEIKSRRWRTPRSWRNEKKILFINYLISYDGIIIRKSKGRNTYPGKKLNCSTNDLNGYIRIQLYFDKIKYRTFIHCLLWETWVGRIPKKLQINHKDGVKNNNLLNNLEIVTPKENMQHAREHGLAYTREQILKTIEANKGRPCSEETRLKISKSNKGRKDSKETRKKKSIANFGKNNPMYNKHHSKKTKEKWSNDRSGENHPNAKLKISDVVEIRVLSYIKHLRQQEIVDRLGFSKENINSILQGYTWNTNKLTKEELIQKTIKEARQYEE